MKRQNIRTLSLVVITLTYLIIGAALFDHFESKNEKIQNRLLNENITQFKLKHGMNDSEFNLLWNKIMEKKPYYAGNQWKFVGSLYFCTVVVTLIGYGHSTPRTVAGKCFCIFYTLIGIPIFLIMFQSVGERLNSLIVFLLNKVKKRLKFKNTDVGLFELITIEGFLTMTITVLASYVFMINENWTYFDSMYYCFITLTTIGFGDIVPMQKNNVLSHNYAYACFTILFILIGLTTLASSMNLLVLRLATINAEEQVQEKLEAAEARRQAVHLEGDVINPNGRLYIAQEHPEQLETISVCSCVCLDYKIWHLKRNRSDRNYLSNNCELNRTANATSINNENNLFSLFRRTGPVKRLLGTKINRSSLKTSPFSNEIEMRSNFNNNKLRSSESVDLESLRNYSFNKSIRLTDASPNSSVKFINRKSNLNAVNLTNNKNSTSIVYNNIINVDNNNAFQKSNSI